MQHFGEKPPLDEEPILIWAFIPYGYEDGRLTGGTYDNELTKDEYSQAFHSLNLRWVWQPIVLETVEHVVAQVVRYQEKHPTLVFNFCDGDDVNGWPGLSVVKALEAAKVVYTGADSAFFQLSTSKIEMKERFVEAGVPTAAFAVLPQVGPIEGLCAKIPPPLFVKPSVSAASYGISLRSVVHNDAEVEAQRDQLRGGEFAEYFANDLIFVERFIDGPEFTVFLGGYWDRPDDMWALPPAQRAFDPSIPEKERFLSYERYWGLYKDETPPPSGGPFYEYKAAPAELAGTLTVLAKRAFCAVKGTGYGRVDFRMDRASGELLVLEVNANCGLSGDDQTSCGSILKLAGLSFFELIGTIVQQTLARTRVAS